MECNSVGYECLEPAKQVLGMVGFCREKSAEHEISN